MDLLLLFAVLATVAYLVDRHLARLRRDRRIAAFNFPPSLAVKVRERYPHISETQSAEVVEGLREYFFVCNRAGRRLVAMPSQAVDVAWHEFILFTRKYEGFCRHALGRFLHHTPAEAMASPTDAQEGIRRAWRIACHREGIEPRQPSRLPTLFAIDAALAIPDGFEYHLDCAAEGQGYCAGHIGCASGCAGGCGGDSDGGCGGGCGGD